MRTLLRLCLLVVLVLGALWLFQHRDLAQAGREVRAKGADVVRDTKRALSDVDTAALMDELKKTGQVVRRKATVAGQKLAEATEDGRTTAAIKAKLALDPELSALDISV